MKRTFICKNCQAQFEAEHYRNRLVCSRRCQYDYHMPRIAGKNKKPRQLQFCHECGTVFEPLHASDYRVYCSFRCKGMGMRRRYSGPNSPTWQGGKTPIVKQLRRGIDYFAWRKRVFERDDYTCGFCLRRGGDVEAHHIRPVSFYPELITDLRNGITLCKPCHAQTKGTEAEYERRCDEVVSSVMDDWYWRYCI